MTEPIQPKPVHLPPFSAWLASNIPAVYDNTMSYYDELTSLIKWLEAEVVPNVDSAITLVNQLKEYVENYFKNLDVQEEINNKLDQMAEDGQLTQLIAQFLTLNAVMSFPNISSMKNAENLVNGSTVETYGYYAIGDKGGAKYQIRTMTSGDTADEITLFALTNFPTLIAELVVESSMDVRQYGAKGDGSTDDTERIQKALDTCSNITVADGTYMVNAVTHILPNSGNKIILSNSATIKAIANDADRYDVVYLDDVDDVEICGGTIEGDKDEHTGATGEWGHCISVMNGSSKIYIHDINLINAWGDGLYLNTCENVNTARVHVNYVRRNGYSLIAVENFNSVDDLIENTNGTAPQAGVDIEPNHEYDNLDNIVFDNLTVYNNTGYGVAMSFTQANTLASHVTFNNLYSEKNNTGFTFSPVTNFTGNVVFNSPVIKDAVTSGIAINDDNNSGKHSIIINDPIIDGYATSGGSDKGIQLSAKYNTTAVANVRIKNPIVKGSQGTNTQAIYLYGRGASYPFKMIDIIDPIDLDGLNITLTYGDLYISDKFEVTRRDYTSNGTVGTTYYSTITNKGAAGNLRFDFSDANTYPSRIVKVNVEESYNITLRFTNQYVYPLSSTVSPDIVLSGKGTSITLEKISTTEWKVLNSVGNITV